MPILVSTVEEGGGQKGGALIGARRAMAEAGIQGVVGIGTSAGAISVYLSTALQMPPREQRLLVSQRDRWGRSMLVRSLDKGWVPWSLLRYRGKFAGEWVLNWLRQRAIDAGLGANVTMGELLRAGRDLTVIAYDRTAGRQLDLNGRTAPGVPAAWAVRASMSIPFVWREVVWQPSWGPYKGRRIAGHRLIDGGWSSNFALDLLTEDSARIRQSMGERPDRPVIGMLLDEGLKPDGSRVPVGKPRNWGIVWAIAEMVAGQMGSRDLEAVERHSECVCRIPVAGFSTLKDLSDREMAELDRRGYNAMRSHIAGRKELKEEGD